MYEGFSPEVQVLLLSVRLVLLSQLGTSSGTEPGHTTVAQAPCQGQSCPQQPTAQIGQALRDAEGTMTSSTYTRSSYLRIQPNLSSVAEKNSRVTPIHAPQVPPAKATSSFPVCG